MKLIYRSPAMVIVLSIVTCGIYSLFWIYQVSMELKAYTNDTSISPGMETFLCIICFPYMYYWIYKYSKVLVNIQQGQGKLVEDNSVLNLVLSIFGLFLVAMAIMQNNMNQISEN